MGVSSSKRPSPGRQCAPVTEMARRWLHAARRPAGLAIATPPRSKWSTSPRRTIGARRGSTTVSRCGSSRRRPHAPGNRVQPGRLLRCADTVVEAIITGRDPRSALWPHRARAVYRLRHRGLAVLADLDASGTERFFTAFFSADAAAQRALPRVAQRPGRRTARHGRDLRRRRLVDASHHCDAGRCTARSATDGTDRRPIALNGSWQPQT